MECGSFAADQAELNSIHYAEIVFIMAKVFVGLQYANG